MILTALELSRASILFRTERPSKKWRTTALHTEHKNIRAVSTLGNVEGVWFHTVLPSPLTALPLLWGEILVVGQPARSYITMIRCDILLLLPYIHWVSSPLHVQKDSPQMWHHFRLEDTDGLLGVALGFGLYPWNNVSRDTSQWDVVWPLFQADSEQHQWQTAYLAHRCNPRPRKHSINVY